MTKSKKLVVVEDAIHWIRGQRVMLDSDLAVIYGTTTKRLLEQLRRNKKRFPKDFAFPLKREELTNLRSQTATSSHGGRRHLPWVFTEHGAVMLASILNSNVAVAASIRVVRAFVRLRELISANEQLAGKFAELEKRLDGQDDSIANLFDAIRQLLKPQFDEKREIGFHIREEGAHYRVRKTKAK